MRRRQTLSWNSLSVKRVLEEFNTNSETGLSPERLEQLQQEFGKNILETAEEVTIFQKILKQFKSPLVYILLAAGIITLFLKEFVDTIVISIALLINVSVGTFQEERASKAFDTLNRSQSKNAIVIRGGHKTLIPAEEVVPGDVVVVESGYNVPADLRLIEAKNLSMNEAALTGEWVAVSKEVHETKEGVSIAEQFNMAWMGTLVASGYGKGVVVATGRQTQVGLIAEHLGATEEVPTPLQQGIRRLARFLIIAIGSAIAMIFVVGMWRGEPLAELLLISIAVAVATMPEGLPAAVTVVLALGMESILKRGGLVRNLLAAETLGATTIILTDKTGTLTQGRMKVSELITLSSITKKNEVDAVSQELTKEERQLLTYSIFASEAFVEEAIDAPRKLTVHGRPVEKALVLEGLEHGIAKQELTAEFELIDYLQFESGRRYGASLNTQKNSTKKKLHINGAPELLLGLATRVYHNGKVENLTEKKREEFLNIQRMRSAEGMRIVGVAYRDVTWEEIPVQKSVQGNDEESAETPILEDLIFMGLVVFNDPVRDDVADSIKIVREAGARVIMLTGDNAETARSIARSVGIVSGENDLALTGADLEKLDDDKLFLALKTTSVFARVLPEQKLRIARLLKNRDEVVAMTGDGVNDAPALRSANIGIAVGSGTEVAKEASDMVLINDSFSVIVAAIEEGRKIIDNLKKIIAYLLSTSFSEIFIIFGALAVGAPIPLLPAQILWANIIGEGLMNFAFAFEKPDEGIMKRNPHSSESKNIMTHELKTMILIISLVTGVFLVALYFLLLRLDLPIEEVRTIMFATLSLDSIFFAFSLKNFRQPIWKVSFFSNIYLIVALCLSTLLLIGALTLAPLQLLLSTSPLTTFEFILLMGVGIFNLATIEIVKYFIFERVKK